MTKFAQLPVAVFILYGSLN